MQQSLLKEFSPWIVFTGIIGLQIASPATAAIVALLLIARFGFENLRDGFILDWVGAIFFFLFAATQTLPISHWFAVHAMLLANAALALVAGLSVIVGTPFTAQYAKRAVPIESWNKPLFIRINYFCSLVWCGVFTTMTAASIVALYYPSLNDFLNNYFSLALVVLGIYAMTWLPTHIKNKHQQELLA